MRISKKVLKTIRTSSESEIKLKQYANRIERNTWKNNKNIFPFEARVVLRLTAVAPYF